MKTGLFCLFENWQDDFSLSLADQIRLIVEAEAMGLDSAWFAEHHFNNFSVCPDPFALLGYAAAKTRGLRLGTAAVLLPFYDPVRVAESAASIDVLSGGRLELGFAKGAFPADHRHFKSSPDENREVMKEGVRLVNRLLGEAGVSSEGPYFPRENITVYPRPIQAHPPIWIATYGSDESVQFAAENGFGIIASQAASIETLEQITARYRSIAGRTPKLAVAKVYHLGRDRQSAIDEAMPAIDHFVRSMQAVGGFNPAMAWRLSKTPEFQQERAKNFSGVTMAEAGLFGTAKECLEQIRTLLQRVEIDTLMLKPASPEYDKRFNDLKVYYDEIAPFI
ncbi:MAG: LLM class flavin-dependent oxidoreductase [Campylobacterales bacterium]